MPIRETSGTSAPLLGASRSDSRRPAERNRQQELAATFGGSDDEDDHDQYGRSINVDLRHDAQAASPPGYVSPTFEQSREEDVFFDAGDALGRSAGAGDPLGADRVNESSTSPMRTSLSNGPQERNGLSYDFECASYFAAPPRTGAIRSPASGLPSSSSSPRRTVSGTSVDTSHRGQSGLAEANVSAFYRARLALGRFGQLVGMRVPGATYSALGSEDDPVAQTRRRQIIGSGVGQDGVFANLNAKPERRRRDNDRGEDDDLVEDTLPPTYETAAADSAPPYWETTIIGGPGGLHPLAPGGMGWTPGGAHVGALEDLIVDGLPVGNFFGFAWNLLVSMSFQFVGFLLTYLLHTTHAARCGSRAGLGITLLQYGFYLRARAVQLADGKLPDDANLLPESDGADTPAHMNSLWEQLSKPETTDAAKRIVGRGLDFVVRQATTSEPAAPTNNTTLADALAADDGLMHLPSAESMSASTEWLAYILMGLGWLILLGSLLSYWKVHRWARQLVDAARRDNQTGSEDEAEPAQSDAPIGFMYTLRNALRNSLQNRRRARHAHSAEDWIIFPGRPRRDLSSPQQSPSRRDEDTDLEANQSSPNEQRLIEDMRSVGLIE